jgi:hypothetical protein
MHPSFVPHIIEVRDKRPITKGWTDHRATVANVQAMLARGSDLGMLGREFCAIDGDFTKPGLAKIARDLALEIFGPAPCRTRGGSKFLLMYRNPGGLRKRRLVIKDQQGDEHAGERLALGQQYVIHGNGCVWDRDPNPWDLADMTDPLWETCVRELAARLQRVAGCTVVKDGLGGGSAGGTVKRVGDEAPEPSVDPITALMWMKEQRGDAHHDPFPHDNFVDLCAAFRGAAGDYADELYDDFRELSPGGRDVDGNTHKTYHSFDSGTSLGWSRLCQITGFVPPDTFDEPVNPDDMPQAPEDVAMNAMLDRYAYVRDQDVFVDLETQVPLTGTQFDRSNRQIAPPGSKGTKAAHNVLLAQPAHKSARAMTYSPGQPVLMQEELDGSLVDCVNTWRPSTLNLWRATRRYGSITGPY